jgi:AraC-like DNA-binding protein
MNPIPLIHAEHVVRISDHLSAAGVPVDRYLERARISPRVREGKPGFVFGRSVWSLLDRVEEGEGLGDFWLDLATRGNWQRASWVRPMTRAATLGDSIRAMCPAYARQIPMNELGLTIDGPVAWFWRRRVTDVRGWKGGEPAEQCTLSFMLAVIRETAGPGWLPELLKLESPSSGWCAATNRLPGVQVQFDQPQLAIAIPVPLLSLPVSMTDQSSSGVEDELMITDFRGSLAEVVKPTWEGCLPSQQLAANLLWMSPRTLRRRLAEEGTTWRRFVHDLLFKRAVDRLMGRRHSIREIAEELGYSNAEHFTRFFRNRAGVPPSAFCEEVEQAQELARQQSNLTTDSAAMTSGTTRSSPGDSTNPSLAETGATEKPPNRGPRARPPTP